MSITEDRVIGVLQRVKAVAAAWKMQHNRAMVAAATNRAAATDGLG